MNRTWAALLLGALLASPAQASARWTTGLLPGQPLKAGEITTLRFAVADENPAGDDGEMEVLLSLDGGKTFSLRVTREMSRETRELRWRVPNLPTSSARLALRTGGDEGGEVIRAVSEEFPILAAESGPLEEVRPFHGEWRAEEALDEIPLPAPFDPPGLRDVSDSIRALRHGTHFARSSDAAPTGAPPDRDPERVAPLLENRVPDPSSLRVPLNVPKRE